MAYFDDLSSCTYFGDDAADSLLAVGWLVRDASYSCGSIDPSLYGRIVELLRNPWQPLEFAGVHNCELCQYEGPMGRSNLFVPNGSHIYVCPELIGHYIAAHHYLPPEQFLNAIVACPDTRTMDYKRLLLESGGRVLLQ